MSSPERRPTSGSCEGDRGIWKKPGNKGRRSMASRSSPVSFKKNEEECLALMRGLRCGVSEDLSRERSFCRIFVGGSQKAGLLEEVDEEKEGQNDIYYKTGESKAAGNSLPKEAEKRRVTRCSPWWVPLVSVQLGSSRSLRVRSSSLHQGGPQAWRE
ncbi:hypothetical protein MLD38_040808 [Melastoma candidum]|nr:hypothetical protein MLD38_040808 [Melastoma candidum]